MINIWILIVSLSSELLRQVARPIRVVAESDSSIVGESLERHDAEET